LSTPFLKLSTRLKNFLTIAKNEANFHGVFTYRLCVFFVKFFYRIDYFENLWYIFLAMKQQLSFSEKISLNRLFGRNQKGQKSISDEFIKSQLRDFLRFGGNLVSMKMGS